MDKAGRWSETTYDAALSAAPTGVALAALDGRWLWVNDALCDLLGRTREQLLVTSIHDVTHPDEQVATATTVERVASGDRPRRSLATRFVDPSGRAIHGLLSVSLVRDDARRAQHLLVHVVDHRPARAQENVVAAVLNAATDYLIAATDLDGVVTLFSAGAERMLGLRAADVVGRHTPASWLADEWDDEDEATLDEADPVGGDTEDAGGRPLRPRTVRMVRADGTPFLAEQVVAPLHGADGVRIGSVRIARDVTEERRLAAEVAELARSAQAQLTSIVSALGLGSFTCDLATGRYRVNEAFAAMFDLDVGDDVELSTLLERIHVDDRARLRARAAGEGEASGEEAHVRVVTPDGGVRHLRVFAHRLDAPAPHGQVVGIALDETERVGLLDAERAARSEAERVREALAHQATHDSLTQLPNRQLLLDRLERALARPTTEGRCAAVVLFVDLDRFKVVNDSLGHAAGDRLLAEAARRVRSVLRPEDLVARLGGDEFVVLLEDVPQGREDAVAARVLEVLSEPYALDAHTIPASASIGIAHAVPGSSPTALLRDADAAMYVAKGRGRGQTARFDAGVRHAALARLELESQLHGVGGRDELVLHYQPAFRADGTVESIEALVRWDHPGRGLLLPAAFLPIAEESGAIVEIGRWVRVEACRQVAQWRAQGLAVPRLWVNVSACELRTRDVARHLQLTCRAAGLAPADVGVEVTESVLMSTVESAELDRVSAAGFAVAIDDFGTGYSSLSYLTRHRVDVLKIDRSFVDRFAREDASTAVVRAVIDLARTLRARSVAEGVETVDQHAALVPLGCDALAGDLLARPAGAGDAARYLVAAR